MSLPIFASTVDASATRRISYRAAGFAMRHPWRCEIRRRPACARVSLESSRTGVFNFPRTRSWSERRKKQSWSHWNENQRRAVAPGSLYALPVYSPPRPVAADRNVNYGAAPFNERSEFRSRQGVEKKLMETGRNRLGFDGLRGNGETVPRCQRRLEETSARYECKSALFREGNLGCTGRVLPGTSTPGRVDAESRAAAKRLLITGKCK